MMDNLVILLYYLLCSAYVIIAHKTSLKGIFVFPLILYDIQVHDLLTTLILDLCMVRQNSTT